MAGGNRDKSNLIPVKKEDGKFDSRQRGMRDQSGRGGPTGGGGKGGVPGMHMNMKKEQAESVDMDPSDLDQDVGAGTSDGDQQEPSSSKKFTGRCRLFVGNLPGNIDENDFKEMFQKFGEVSEVFLNASRSFGFVKLDTRQNAETAKAALDGVTKAGRTLRVRFATHGAALKVKHLSPHVTNELLEEAFTIFGSVERAVVIVDDRGKPTGEGIVEFARKPGAQQALKRINDGVFLLTTTPRPIAAEPLEQRDEEDGYPERFVPRNNEFNQEREQGPRFAQPGSFEYEFSLKWKELYVLEKQEQENVKRKMEDHEKRLLLDMEAAYHEYQTNMLRQDLLRRQEELKRLEEQHQQMLERS